MDVERTAIPTNALDHDLEGRRVDDGSQLSGGKTIDCPCSRTLLLSRFHDFGWSDKFARKCNE
jgi:hypothetical protein